MRRRWLAALALLLAAATGVLALVVAVSEFPRGLVLLALGLLAAVTAWYAVVRRGFARVVGLVVAAVALVAAVIVILTQGAPLVDGLVLAGVVLTVLTARSALHVHIDLPRAPAPQHPVLFFNPRSGGGKAERFRLAEEAAHRGMETVELRPGDDLEALVRAAVGRGADGLAMAGGDGSQAVVAAVAAACGLPYACVPAGTRNHFALDLGVDRDDVVGALDAFVDGGERRVDLAEVNGRVFVNNVSLGLYAQAVQRAGYRDAKIRTLLDTVPDVLGPDVTEPDMRWQGPGGHEHRGGAAVLVSNNRYRLGRAVGSGTRPRIDDGLLGITVVGSPTGAGPDGGSSQRPWREWSAPSFDVETDHPLPAGIDGETVVLEPPLHFHIRPGVLQVRVARQHPGASPSAMVPEGMWAGVAELARIALGRQQAPEPSPPGRPSPQGRNRWT